MKCQSFNSTLLDRALYDEGSTSIVVRFRNGAWYRYTAVDPDMNMGAVFDELSASDRPSAYFHQHLRNNKRFDCKRIPESEATIQ